MPDQPAQPGELVEARMAGLVARLDRIGPLQFRFGRWRCPRCGKNSAAAEDFQSGLVLEGSHCVRRHPPRRKLRCLIPSCCHVEVVEDPNAVEVIPVPPDPLLPGGDAVIPAAVRRLLKPMPPSPLLSSTRTDRRPRKTDLSQHSTQANEVDAATAWRRVRSCLLNLFEALADLEEAGGLRAAANDLRWKRRRRAKHLGLLGLVHRMLADAMR